jgi:probable rRNA maturation factor
MPLAEPLVLMRRAPAALRRGPLDKFARCLVERVTAGDKFECLITDDRELRRLNREFLGRDYATDVLSFPGARDARPAHGAAQMPVPPLLGEVAISAERAADQARDFGHSLTQEVCILMLHGVLHLLGMDHERDRGAMARAEAAWRKKLGLPPGLIERVGA